MTHKYLLQVSIGPVQDFIAAARRTRDLWFGSELLSQISGVVAETLEEKGCHLIFPHSTRVEGGVANVILAVAEADMPGSLVEAARESAEKKWANVAEEVLKGYESVIQREVWDKQVEDVIEVYGAWVPYDGTDIKGARTNVSRLMAGRKVLRNFRPANGVAGLSKSSLDGARETVLRGVIAREYLKPLRKGRIRFRKVGENWSPVEQLDVIGMVKRFGGKNVQYPSVSRLAVDPWIRGLTDKERTNLIEAASGLKSDYQIAEYDERLYSQFMGFPYEGAVLFPGRLRELMDDPDAKVLDKKLEDFSDVVSATRKDRARPSPYYAILIADGDTMGAALAELNTEERLKKFSKQLAEFSAEVKKIIEQQHSGCLVYAGGDDVVAFLPEDNCLEAAQALYEAFTEKMGQFPGSPTLSVGIAIGHCMEPLENMLNWARLAEKDAKTPDRDGLAIHYHTRSGAPTTVRGQWSKGIMDRIEKWIRYFNEKLLPDKAAYDLRQLANTYESWQESDLTRRAVIADVKRLVGKKKTSGGDVLSDDVATALEAALQRDGGQESVRDAVLTLAKELIIARLIAESIGLARSRTDRNAEVGVHA